MEPLDALRDTWNHPGMRHAALVHLPIALSIIGLPAALIAATASRGRWPRGIATALYLLMAASAWPAMNSGENAENALPPDLHSAATDLIHDHEERAEYIWLFALGTGALLAAGFINKQGVRLVASWLGLLAALFTAAWVADTAHYGGEAVYRFAAGTAGALPNVDDAASTTSLATSNEAPGTLFATGVRPILEANCLRCHDERRQRGGLDQSSLASILKGGESGPAIVPGNPQASLLYLKITHADDEQAMPPGGRRLSAEQIATIEQWIRDGAPG